MVYTKYFSVVVVKSLETFSHLSSQARKSIFALSKQSRPVVGKLSPTILWNAVTSLSENKVI